VQIAVLEVRHGKTELDNRSRVKDDVVLRYMEPLAGRLIEQGTLERRLLLVYDLTGVGQPKSVFRPGAEAGESDRSEFDNADDFCGQSVDADAGRSSREPIKTKKASLGSKA